MSQRRRPGLILTLLALAAIAIVTLVPTDVPPGDSEMLCIVCGARGGVDAVLNVILFLPLGFGARLAGLSRVRVLLLVAAATGGIELLQLHAVTGRDASLGDVLFNTAGGTAGALIAEHWRMLLFSTGSTARRLTALALAVWLATLATTTILFAPSIRGERFEWAIAPSLDGTIRFRGRVLEARLAGRPLGATMLSRAAVLEAIADSGVRVGATVVPGVPSAGLAPLVRLASDRDDEIVMLSQLGTRLVLEARTRAADLRLRPPSVTLDGVFPTTTARSESIVSARGEVHDGRLVVTASAGGRTRRTRLVLRPTLGWMLLVPGRVVVPGPLGAISLLWIAGFLVPVGYWGALASTLDRDGRTAWRLLGSLAPVYLTALAGLAAAPLLSGIGRATPLEWLGAAASLAGGAAMASVAQRWRSDASNPRVAR